MAKREKNDMEDIEQTTDATPDGPEAPVEGKGAKKPGKTVSLLDQAVALLSPRRGGRQLTGAQLDVARRKRLAEIVPVLKAAEKGHDMRPPDMLAQYRFELRHLVAGTWVPGLRAPKGQGRQLAEDITGGHGLSVRGTTAGDQNLDAVLESAGDGE